MLISTLPDLGGRAFEVRGLVFADGALSSLGGTSVHQLVQQLVYQATHFEADGIVDVKTLLSTGQHTHCVMTGTAVKLL
ncbi:hypothetical protein Cs7R123_65170 [Catellatospora sp. TT07R-123]|uniref:hypothetical protein n=1 Tax=Catellatospora sp. TT07R-123 TaxID=2733863 RepID=UPI001B1E09FC|nr:hypothetical protein [Catellatospora sp. TT07R-123]GHJ49175.1 hypothetical protein Cs7R123_65170 [Catellatospora sp. TT07R-123]